MRISFATPRIGLDPTIPAKKLARFLRVVGLGLTWGACTLFVACAGVSTSSPIPSPPPPVPVPVAPGPPGQGIPNMFFGLNPHPEVLTSIGWPLVHFGSVRLWGAKTTWYDINTSAGVYDWTQFDAWLSAASQNGATDLLYTFGAVPAWASSNPNDQTCVVRQTPAGSCDAPTDLNPDGTGPDQIWQDFVRAIVTHAAGKVHYWEVWNEANVAYEWNGTQAQMARMSVDAYNVIKSIDSTALVTTPSTVNAGNGQSISNWLPGYFAAGGDTRADIVAFHGYVDPAVGQPAEQVTNIVSTVFTIVPPALQKKLFFDTEGSWGDDSTHLSDPDLQAGYVARMHLLQWSAGVQRFYWFQYGNQQTGTLCGTGNGNGCTLNKAGVAYLQVYDWMVGATMANGCTANGSVWTCNMTKPGGVQEQAVWDTSQTCSNGNCTTSSYSPNSTYVKYADLAGNVTNISGSTVPIGAKPILLLNQ